MPIPYFPTRKDGRNVSQDNDLKVLNVLRLFGHLRRQEIAMALWPRSTPQSAYIMACRTINRLLERELVLKKTNTLGGDSFVLSSKGVGEIFLKTGETAQEGYQLAFDGPQFFHRTLGTTYLLDKARRGHEVFGEYAVIKSLAPVTRDFLRQKYKKVPDGLIVYSPEVMGFKDDMRGADWIEVESAYKTYDELEKSLAVLTKNTELNEKGSLLLDKLVFVFDSRQKHERHIMRAAQAFLRDHPELTRETFLQSIVLAKCFVDPPFAWKGAIEADALSLLEKERYADFEAASEVSADAEDYV